MDLDDLPRPDPTLVHLFENQSLKWVFVGGKGGVGKTTCSCSIALQFARRRESVLIISTDPAHNLSDALNQKFSKEPTAVAGVPNLFAMEVDPTFDFSEENENFLNGGEGMKFFQEISASIPGIDEAMSFATVMKFVQNMKFSVVVFDTAPTGHTLRFLSFPSILEKGFAKLGGVRDRFSGLFSQVFGMLGAGGSGVNEETLTSQFESLKAVTHEINEQFKNPDLTTFVCVCIPEFLSVYETERMIQELAKFEIDVGNVIINQVLFPKKDGHCDLCTSRSKMQQRYVDQVHELYDLFHVITLPLLRQEVRGVEALTSFSQNLLTPFVPTE